MKNNDLPTEQDFSIKQLLKETRKAQKLSIDDAAKKLRINKNYLRALENNEEKGRMALSEHFLYILYYFFFN